jgi:hypothetical protein
VTFRHAGPGDLRLTIAEDGWTSRALQFVIQSYFVISRSAYIVLPVVAALLVGGCGVPQSRTFRDQTHGITLRYPVGWSVTGFSRTVSPSRIVLASYKVTLADVEGDCGGRRALTALPGEGAAVLLMDMAPRTMLLALAGSTSLQVRSTSCCGGSLWEITSASAIATGIPFPGCSLPQIRRRA